VTVRRPSLRNTLLLVGLPLLILVGVRLALSDRTAGDDGAAERAAQQVHDGFASLLDTLVRVGDRALSGSLDTAGNSVRPAEVRRRIEGVGLLDAEGQFLEWTGSPSDPPDGFLDPAWPPWIVRVDGVRTRLLTRAGPDAAGRTALVSFVIDSDFPADGFERLLPSRLIQRYQVQSSFLDSQAHYRSGILCPPPDAGLPRGFPPFGTRAPDARDSLLYSSSGHLLAALRLSPVSTGHRTMRAWATARAWAACAASGVSGRPRSSSLEGAGTSLALCTTGGVCGLPLATSASGSSAMA